ncbi:MAG: hypothetical protein V1848_03745 [Candidatus Magasanikbacteria bacterium]
MQTLAMTPIYTLPTGMKKTLTGIVGVFGVLACGFLAYMGRMDLVILFVLSGMVSLFAWKYNNIAWLLLVVLACFHPLQLDFGTLRLFRDIPFISGINAPLADIFSLFMISVFLLKYVLGYVMIPENTAKRLFPLVLVYMLYLGVSFVSIFSAYNHNAGESLHYFVRFPLFVFLAYFMYPALHLRTAKQFEKVFDVLYFVGIAVALYGFLSLGLAEHASSLRVEPFGIFGWYPLGKNHNLIAEVLAVIFPVGVYMAYKYSYKKIYLVGTLFILFVGLMTLSRAFALVIAVEVLVFFLNKNFREKIMPLVKKWKMPIITVFLGFALYMGIFMASDTVISSNSSRILTTDISWFYLKQSPILGNGPGMYMDILENTYAFTLDHGEALDAHGLVQKLAVETGILGILTFGLFLLCVFYSLFQLRNGSYFYLVLLAMAVGGVVFQIFNTSYFTSIMWFPLGLAIASFGIMEPYDKTNR